MKIFDIKHIINNRRFWVYFLSVAFPLAFDEEDDHLQELICERYDVAEDSENMKWYRNFVQYYDNVFDENDGYIDDPTSVVITAEKDRYIIQFHPGDILYFLNGKQIGCTGPHYKVHQISLPALTKAFEAADEPASTALLLPMLFIRDSEISAAKELLGKMLKAVPLERELLDTAISLIINGAKL